MPNRWMILSVVLVVGLVCEYALAQQTSSRSTSTRSSSGSSTTRSLGSSLNAGTRTSFSSATGGRGGTGSSGNFGVGSAGTVDSSDRFVRGSRQAGAFVGADASETREFVGSVAAGSSSGSSYRNIRRGGGGSSGSSANVNRGGTSSRRGRQTNDVRVTINVGFALPPGKVAVEAQELAAARLVGRMERSTWIQKRSPLEVRLDQGIATLRGVVATEHDRVLAEQLARLEPGIELVKNELMVQPPEPAAPAPVPLPPNPNTLPE